MDVTFHYPPELFQLLVDTIPLLNKSKNDLLLFFRGAGVADNMLADLEKKVQYDRESTNKYEITRTLLRRLNEKGESTLRERREILKRVVEFENFSSCWPDDQIKAKGFVAEVRKVVNVKDSFTRMNLERKREKNERRKEYQAKMQAMAEKKARLETVRNDLNALITIENPQRRGKQLESVLNRLFDAYGVLVREAFELQGEPGQGTLAQIDGLIEFNSILYLVEMKWWNKPLGKEQVSPHLVDVYNRGHPGGILISASGFTEAAVQVYRTALSEKIVFLCELEEIVVMLETDQDLLELLREKYISATVDSNPMYRVRLNNEVS